MPLTPIEQGDEVLSKPLQDNFEYLDGRITTTNQTLSSNVSSLQSSITTLSTSVSDNYARKDLSNATGLTQVRVVVETFKQGNDWYRIYDDRWCEQGGYGSGNIAFYNEFLDSSYALFPTNYTNKTVTGFTLPSANNWMAVGYLADES